MKILMRKAARVRFVISLTLVATMLFQPEAAFALAPKSFTADVGVIKEAQLRYLGDLLLEFQAKYSKKTPWLSPSRDMVSRLQEAGRNCGMTGALSYP